MINCRISKQHFLMSKRDNWTSISVAGISFALWIGKETWFGSLGKIAIQLTTPVFMPCLCTNCYGSRPYDLSHYRSCVSLAKTGGGGNAVTATIQWCRSVSCAIIFEQHPSFHAHSVNCYEVETVLHTAVDGFVIAEPSRIMCSPSYLKYTVLGKKNRIKCFLSDSYLIFFMYVMDEMNK